MFYATISLLKQQTRIGLQITKQGWNFLLNLGAGQQQYGVYDKHHRFALSAPCCRRRLLKTNVM